MKMRIITLKGTSPATNPWINNILLYAAYAVFKEPRMTAKQYFSGIFFSCFLPLFFCSCGEKKTDHRLPRFTRTDSLTETYLALQDSMLLAWNVMINDDNQKIDAMYNILHELKVSGADQAILDDFTERLNQLKRSRYTQKTMANSHIVEEYDFASNSLVAELIALAESQRQFAYNTTLQKLTDSIRTADQRVARYREQYDQVTERYNAFLEGNRDYLRDIDSDTFMGKKPLFQMVAE